MMKSLRETNGAEREIDHKAPIGVEIGFYRRLYLFSNRCNCGPVVKAEKIIPVVTFENIDNNFLIQDVISFHFIRSTFIYRFTEYSCPHSPCERQFLMLIRKKTEIGHVHKCRL